MEPKLEYFGVRVVENGYVVDLSFTGKEPKSYVCNDLNEVFELIKECTD